MLPPGAVDEATPITVQAMQPDPNLPANLIPGTVFDFQPDGTVFVPPASLTLSYDEANLGGVPESELTILTEKKGGGRSITQA